MQIDLENQSLVGLAFVLEAVAAELLTAYLSGLAPAERQAASDRITAQTASSAKQLVDLAPKQLLSNATKTQAASARIAKALIADAMTKLGAHAPAAPKKT